MNGKLSNKSLLTDRFILKRKVHPYLKCIDRYPRKHTDRVHGHVVCFLLIRFDFKLNVAVFPFISELDGRVQDFIEMWNSLFKYC